VPWKAQTLSNIETCILTHRCIERKALSVLLTILEINGGVRSYVLYLGLTGTTSNALIRLPVLLLPYIHVTRTNQDGAMGPKGPITHEGNIYPVTLPSPTVPVLFIHV